MPVDRQAYCHLCSQAKHRVGWRVGLSHHPVYTESWYRGGRFSLTAFCSLPRCPGRGHC
jgi:hypothetical protein